MQSPFSVKTGQRDGAAVITVEGEFDLAGVPEFDRARNQALRWKSPIVVDLTDCEFIDSTGIGCLIEGFRAAAQAGLPYALVGSGLQVKRVLELVGISDHVPSFDSLGAALAGVRTAESIADEQSTESR